MPYNYAKLASIKNTRLCIYKLTNTQNGKVYVGKTEPPLIFRIRRHCAEARKGTNRYLYDAIRHYGWDVFTVDVLETCPSKKELSEREIYWISVLKSNEKQFGYNLTEGGDGCPFSPDALKKSADLRRGKPRSDEVKKKISDGNKGHNRPIAKEAKIKISQSLKEWWEERTDDVPAHCIGNFTRGKPGMRLGIKHTEESKKLMSLHQTGVPRWTEEQKQQMTIDRQGKDNPFWKTIDIELMISLIKSGLSLANISVQMDTSEPTLISRIQEYLGYKGITEAYWELIEKPKLIASISNGSSREDLAKEISVSPNSISIKIKKLGYHSLNEARKALRRT